MHESIPLLYISTGTGPYYPSLSPIVRNEWQWLAFNEVTRMTSFGGSGSLDLGLLYRLVSGLRGLAGQQP